MLKLIENINAGKTTFDELGAEGLEELISESIVNGDFSALQKLTNIYTGIYDYGAKERWWLLSRFEDDLWLLDFSSSERKKNRTSASKPRELNWGEIYLDDGIVLTAPKHRKLLDSFKNWILSADNPLDNGGKLVRPETARMKANSVISMINAILVQSQFLGLSRYQLLNVNDDFWLNILVNITRCGGLYGVFDLDKQLSSFLNKMSRAISDEHSDAFALNYPHITQPLDKDDIRLSLNNRTKACAWLFENGFYESKAGKKIAPLGNISVILPLIFKGRTLTLDGNFPRYKELILEPAPLLTEFEPIPNRNYGEGYDPRSLQRVIKAIKLIHTNIGNEGVAQPNVVSRYITPKFVMENESARAKTPGRTRTLPPELVFKLIRQCYEYVKEQIPNSPTKGGSHPTTLLDEIINFLSQAAMKTGSNNSNRPSKLSKHYQEEKHGHLPHTERSHWMKYEAIDSVNAYFIERGVKQIAAFDASSEDRFARRRNNESLFELYGVLLGAIALLLGALMARRQDELIELQPHGNLSPNLDPFLENGSTTNYNLKFKVKKSGLGGKTARNEVIERPLPHSIARIIWQLEQFNLNAIDKGITKGKLGLFNNLNANIYKLTPMDGKIFNNHLNLACDYFETEIVQYDTGEIKRNYVRIHQLRRFFAMAFFWSKRYKGMEALRWMLAHSDMEHLYHYISESDDGAVLIGVKATTITRSLSDPNSELYSSDEVEKLRKIIAKRVLGDESKSVDISTASDTYEYYEDESYHTVPHISKIEQEQAFENEVLTMLEGDEISLEPEFFTVTNSDGTSTKTFTLMLKIKDLD